MKRPDPPRPPRRTVPHVVPVAPWIDAALAKIDPGARDALYRQFETIARRHLAAFGLRAPAQGLVLSARYVEDDPPARSDGRTSAATRATPDRSRR